jgi:caa(3)-type oxidase subunit IV
LPKTAQIAALVVIAIIKAALVVLFYMHLRYDSKWYMLILLVEIFFALPLGRFLPLMLR